MTEAPPPQSPVRHQAEPKGPGRLLLFWSLGIIALTLGMLVLAFALLEQAPAHPVTPAARPSMTPIEDAEALLSSGETEAAIAILLAVPPTHRRYSRAQRLIGWDIYTRELGLPRQGLPFTRRSLLAEPGSSNCWEDFGRVLLRSIQE